MDSLCGYILCIIFGIFVCISLEVFIIWYKEYSVLELLRCTYNIISSNNRNHKVDKELTDRY